MKDYDRNMLLRCAQIFEASVPRKGMQELVNYCHRVLFQDYVESSEKFTYQLPGELTPYWVALAKIFKEAFTENKKREDQYRKLGGG